MKTSRKRLSGRKDDDGNKRKLRRSKKKRVDNEEINSDSDIDVQNDILIEPNKSAVSLETIQTCSNPYNNDIDKKMIKYFKANMNLLNMIDDESVFHVLKAKYSFQKSAKSLQLRFVNVILPNLFKYDIMNQAELIDFYDAAKLELPEEFVNLLNKLDNSNINISSQNNISKKTVSKTKDDTELSALKNKEVADKENISVQNENISIQNENISVQNENINASNTSTQLDSQTQSSTSKNMETTKERNISDQNEDIVLETCRQSNSQVKEASVWKSRKIKNLDINSNRNRNIAVPGTSSKSTSKNSKSKRKNNISDQNEDIAILGKSRKSNSLIEKSNSQTEEACTKSCTSKNKEVTNEQNISDQNEAIFVPNTSRKSNNQTETNTSNKMNLKSILNFILFYNLKDNCVLIPDTEPDIPSIEKRLLDEFEIRKESIKIISKNKFDKINRLKISYDTINELLCEVIKNRIHTEQCNKTMLVDAEKLLERIEEFKTQLLVTSGSQEIELLSNSPNSVGSATPSILDETVCTFNSTRNEIEIDNLGEIIASLSDNEIISNNENNGSDATMADRTPEPLRQDIIENVPQSQNLGEITALSDKMDHVPIITNIQNDGSDAIMSDIMRQDNDENVAQSQNLLEITALSENMDQMPINTNNENIEYIGATVEIKSEPLFENDDESVVLSQYLEEIPASSSDNMNFMSIISNIQNDGCVGAMVEIKSEPLDQDDVETIVRSPYFMDDHSYCKSDVADSTVEYFTANDFDLENTATNMEYNSRTDCVTESACIPQVMFSKRCIDKILNENINVEHLLVKCASNDNKIPSPQIYGGYGNTPDST